MAPIPTKLAQELNIQEGQVLSTIQLLEDGCTVPFIARYRKEATQGLNDEQLRTLQERLQYLQNMEERRTTILNTIEEQGKLTAELKQAILDAETKTRLEDLYLPYKTKRRTKATQAREAGLEPLALSLLQNPSQEPETVAANYVHPEKDVPDIAAALTGAQHILVENFSEHPELLGRLRKRLQRSGQLKSKLVKGKEAQAAKFSDYFDYQEPLQRVPSHRALAIFRGVKEGVLKATLTLEDIEACEQEIDHQFHIRDEGRPSDDWLLDAVSMAWKEKIHPHLQTELLGQLKEEAGTEAIGVFAKNLKNLLLAAPAGNQVTMGLDPGFRTGVKVAIVDGTGKVLETGTIYPHEPQRQWGQSLQILTNLTQRFNVTLISIGNGTASRETDKLVQEFLKDCPAPKPQKLVTSEAGASVYSASKLATQELPDLDVSLRGAVSIARRLQDPLAELVKIDPKSIGVGQYQHDVDQKHLGEMLGNVVEDCVNAVGVDVNTASPSLLTFISGLNSTLAENIVAYRDEHGPFSDRKALKDVPRMGPKAFEQAAGFLRIPNGRNPLDASAVHPEAYPLVERIMTQLERPLQGIMGQTALLQNLNPEDFTDEKFGLPTVQDILSELDKPGRDPRPAFKTATFQEGIETLKDLKPAMVLEGVITNVTNFGAFVDVGVHQDGLVHVSQLADHYVKDPHSVVKTGDVVTVRVVEVDTARKRIGLSMKNLAPKA